MKLAILFLVSTLQAPAHDSAKVHVEGLTGRQILIRMGAGNWSPGKGLMARFQLEDGSVELVGPAQEVERARAQLASMEKKSPNRVLEKDPGIVTIKFQFLGLSEKNPTVRTFIGTTFAIGVMEPEIGVYGWAVNDEGSHAVRLAVYRGRTAILLPQTVRSTTIRFTKENGENIVRFGETKLELPKDWTELTGATVDVELTSEKPTHPSGL